MTLTIIPLSSLDHHPTHFLPKKKVNRIKIKKKLYQWVWLKIKLLNKLPSFLLIPWKKLPTRAQQHKRSWVEKQPNQLRKTTNLLWCLSWIYTTGKAKRRTPPRNPEWNNPKRVVWDNRTDTRALLLILYVWVVQLLLRKITHTHRPDRRIFENSVGYSSYFIVYIYIYTVFVGWMREWEEKISFFRNKSLWSPHFIPRSP